MNAPEMEAAVRGYFEAVGAGDRGRLLELFDPALCWRVPKGAIEPYAGVHQGAASIIDLMLTAVSGAFVRGSQTTEIRNFAFAENLAVVETEMTAETPAGARYQNQYTFFFEFRDGRISEIREYVDTRYAADFFAGGND